MDDLMKRLQDRPDRKVTVLVASTPLGHKLKYVDQVAATADENMTFMFRQSVGRLGDVDVLHLVDSADTFLGLNDSSTPKERMKRTRAFVDRLSTHEVALVRTLYGPSPELAHPLEAEAASLLDSATARFVTVNRATRTPDPARTAMIPYADLSERFAGYPTRDQIPTRLLCITDEKPGVVAEGILKTFFVNRTPGLTLRLAGGVNQLIHTELERARERTPNLITVRNELLSDAALVEEITAAELVVVPEPSTLAGYQLLMMALSFGRPTIAPDNKMLRALQDEVGESWVVPLATPITAERLDAAIAQARQSSPETRPNLNGRGWRETGRRYAQVYRDAVDESRATATATIKTVDQTINVSQSRHTEVNRMKSVCA